MKEKIRAFLERKNIKISAKTYFIDAMGSMALGLFASLLIGTIFDTLGKYLSVDLFLQVATYAKAATGAVLAMAIANSLKAPPLVLFSAGAVGLASYQIGGTFLLDGTEKAIAAGPCGVFFVAIIAVEIGKMVSKETKVDILVTPVVTILAGVLVSNLICPAIAYAMYWIGYFVNTATVIQPFLMGIIISVVVGMILTLPISSAAICSMIGITGLAGGAATAGCCAQMVGFAVMSFKENGWGGIVAQGLGTSMLQMGNITKNPKIWIPATLASAITGPISTLVFKLECTGVAAGMGTCGLVGPIGIISAMESSPMMWIGVIVVCIVLPAILTYIFSEILRKWNWIKENDLKLDL